MDLPDRHMLIGMTLGAICATALAAIGPGFVFADEAGTANGIDPDALVRIGEADYRITHQDWVATEPRSHARVMKIGYGNVSYVDIATTETGTYSTDGFASPHVLYPGIDVERVETAGSFAVIVTDFTGPIVAGRLAQGSSFINLALPDGRRLVSTGTGMACQIGPGAVLC